MFISINDKETLNNNHIWLDKFERELYIPNFPNENEREPFSNIKQRIENNEYPKTTITLLVNNEQLTCIPLPAIPSTGLGMNVACRP